MALTRIMTWQRISESEKDREDEEATTALLTKTPTHLPPSRTSHLLPLLTASNLVTGVLLLYLLLLQPFSKSCTSLESTHFVPHDGPIPLDPVTTQFQDFLQFNTTNHQFWRDFSSTVATKSLYFGPPSTLIDAAWADLLRGEFPGLSEQEVNAHPRLRQAFVEEDRHPKTGRFHIGLDVLHSLHCLNAVRKAITGSDHPSPLWGGASQQREHIDHCLNHIRQSLQCRPDLTPAAMKKYSTADGQEFYIGNAEVHSCYDWSRVRDWLDERKASPFGAWEN